MGKNGFDDYDRDLHRPFSMPDFANTVLAGHAANPLYAEIDRLRAENVKIMAESVTRQKMIQWLASKLANRGDCPDAAGLFPHFPGCEDNAKCDDDDYCWETMARRRVEEGA